jgi:hypothetical protein
VGAACPVSFDGTEANLPACPPGDSSISARQCGDLVELELGNFAGGVQCAYDARTHALVGAMIYSDVNDYCDGDSFTKMAGRVPEMSCSAIPFSVKKDCTPVSQPDGASND